MTTVEIFKNCNIDNISRVSSYSTLSNQNLYYEGLITAGSGVQLVGTFRNIGEPILLPLSFDSVIQYNYGRFKTGDIWYYFSIVDLESVNGGKTRISYKLDCWETARLQMNVSLGRGMIRRSSYNFGLYKKSEIQPIRSSYNKLDLFNQNLGSNICVLIFYRDSSSNTNNIYELDLEYDVLDKIVKCKWNEFLNVIPGYADSNIIGAWISPISAKTLKSIFWETVNDENQYWKLYKMVDTSFYLGFSGYLNLSNTILSNDTQTDSICDMRGNIIWSCPYQKTYTTECQVILDISPTTCKWSCKLASSEFYDHEFTIPCEPLSNFTDSYLEYFVRQRETDINTRKLANQKGLASGIVSSGSAAGIGGITSGAVGAGMGGLSVISSIGNYAIGEYYGPKEQAITDKAYEKANDELSLIGDSIASLLLKTGCGVKIIRETYDSYTNLRIANEVANQGHSVDIMSNNCQQYYTIGYMSGEFEILGNIPESWKVQIKSRFEGGVKIV